MVAVLEARGTFDIQEMTGQTHFHRYQSGNLGDAIQSVDLPDGQETTTAGEVAGFAIGSIKRTKTYKSARELRKNKLSR
jgi:hypothetical protein